jgi:pyruvate/2-oxoglutarate dehydrogenase complex dihydrolipoamide dehydrogenase (E3) component/uncharacterized membrane protein YdjX (TVP38/TMEM64 family)
VNKSAVLRLAALLLLAGSVAVLLIFFPVKQYLFDLLEWVRGMGAWGPVLLGAVYILACVLFIPGSLLTLGAGFVFGIVVGTITVSIASTLGATAAFLLGRTLARPWIEARVAHRPKFRALDEAVRRQGFKIVLLTRLSPIFPFNLLNYTFGLTRVSLRDYILASWIGMLPGTVMYVYLGTTLKTLADLAAGNVPTSVGQQVLFGAGLVATVAVTVLITRLARKALQEAIPPPTRQTEPLAHGDLAMPNTVQVLPDDVHNQTLVANVHPRDWVNPQPQSRYNLVVIGAGTGGLVCAAGAAGLGARVALVEKHLLGGDCLNVGCVPSKALLRAARAYADVRDAAGFGVTVPPGAKVDFPAVMERMRRLRAGISPNDSAARFHSLGVDVFLGAAHFTGPDAVEVNGQTLRFARAVIATGGRPIQPPIPGLAEAGFQTNETIFSLMELPRRLAVIGAGPIGCELVQAFARFGSQTFLVGKQPQILPREDPDAAQLVETALQHDGVQLLLGHDLRRVERSGGERVLCLESPHGPKEIRVDDILVAVGRVPNVDGLNLEAAGVAHDSRIGVQVDDRLRTTSPRIYAVGDVCSRYQFTHAADAMARLAIQNALFFGGARLSALTIPWCTYTDPEIAHVGLYERQAQEQGIAVQTLTQPLDGVDRALLDGETAGFVRVHLRRGTDKILGATIVARHAGDMISELTLAMTGGLGLRTPARTIHPYPTQAEAIKKVADAYNRTRLTPFVKRMLDKWMAWTR